jgi:hypothetical protein
VSERHYPSLAGPVGLVSSWPLVSEQVAVPLVAVQVGGDYSSSPCTSWITQCTKVHSRALPHHFHAMGRCTLRSIAEFQFVTSLPAVLVTTTTEKLSGMWHLHPHVPSDV